MSKRNKPRRSAHSIQKGAQPVLPAKPPQAAKAQISGTIEHVQYSGPIPDPTTLKKYEETLPGAADRILAMAEGQGDHRRKLETQALEAEVGDRKRGRNEARLGQIFALIVGLAAIVAGAYTAVQGHGVAGSVIGGGGVIGLVSVFIAGQAGKRAESGTGEKAE